MNNKNTSIFLASILVVSSFISSTNLVSASSIDYTNYTGYENEMPINEEKYETYTMPATSIKLFKLKTTDDYEVALSKDNGEYTYLDSSNMLEEAIEIADNLKYAYKNAIPVVINNKGMIVYATEALAKIVKTKDGQLVSQNTTINLYKDTEGNHKYTYISPGAIEDAPIIDISGNMVKIEVAGFTGWMPISDTKGDNLVVVPINNIKNLSYYQINEKNELIHNISKMIEKEGNFESIIIGKAPSFMKPTKKYYSYDGKYFYDDIKKLISDLKEASHSNAINNYSPYYNYYNILPGKGKTSYTAAELNSYIDKYAPSNSVLKGSGESFIKYQSKYGVNALMALSISINESAFGTRLVKPNNIFGIKANDGAESGASKFASIDECIKVFMENYMSKTYYNQKSKLYNGSNLGNKNSGVNINYASDPYWGEKAASHMYKIDKYLSDGKLKEYNKEEIYVYKRQSDNKLILKGIITKEGIKLDDKSKNYTMSGEETYDTLHTSAKK
ncbi:glucosaminidase domain-containing protein [Romboutsia lituseburensis]|uniref:glucosaminidase domain-containing protein n=1 Tax=Romboutsia lituseburensis TaxID=1537 RepID=UPI00215A4787|nr:glucosaminidase domain-containing protein [Romboutsia lituseburensis]MCR8745466.1 glucosaminidase domain-containing protein [Romboutsia lituseburensis]